MRHRGRQTRLRIINAGIINKNKNIIGMMPHPERCVESLLGGTDGSGVFQSLVNK